MTSEWAHNCAQELIVLCELGRRQFAERLLNSMEKHRRRLNESWWNVLTEINSSESEDDEYIAQYEIMENRNYKDECVMEEYRRAKNACREAHSLAMSMIVETATRVAPIVEARPSVEPIIEKPQNILYMEETNDYRFDLDFD